jgi:hypothetical protein
LGDLTRLPQFHSGGMMIGRGVLRVDESNRNGFNRDRKQVSLTPERGNGAVSESFGDSSKSAFESVNAVFCGVRGGVLGERPLTRALAQPGVSSINGLHAQPRFRRGLLRRTTHLPPGQPSKLPLEKRHSGECTPRQIPQNRDNNQQKPRIESASEADSIAVHQSCLGLRAMF